MTTLSTLGVSNATPNDERLCLGFLCLAHLANLVTLACNGEEHGFPTTNQRRVNRSINPWPTTRGRLGEDWATVNQISPRL